MELGQEGRFPAKFRRQPALRAPHDEPRLQRPALSHAGAQAAGAGLYAARPQGAAAARRGAGRPPARRGGRGRPLRPHRRFRLGHPGAAHWRHARRAANGARAAARLGALEPVLSREQFACGTAAVAEFKDYLIDLVRRRLREKNSDEAEILSTLIGASAFDPRSAGERLSEVELLHNCIFLLNAGHETTTNLIGNGIDLLIRHPQAMRELRDDPALIEGAVEEFLRMESSNQLGNRRAAKDTALDGVAMPAGTYVHIGIGAANRDPAQFPDPERLDLRRQPNRHLAFATGIHACAGMSLARMEAQVAIGKFARRFAEVERDGAFVRGGRARFRGFLHYPLRIG